MAGIYTPCKHDGNESDMGYGGVPGGILSDVVHLRTRSLRSRLRNEISGKSDDLPYVTVLVAGALFLIYKNYIKQ